MRNLIMKRDGEASFVTWIKKRIKMNLNFLALFQGPTGIGKSWTALSIAYQLDDGFGIENVAFDFRGVMNIINAEWFRNKKIKVILFDEAQCDISNREWQSLTNRLMNYLLSTFRHQNIILLFTSPYSDFLDSHSKKLLHCIFDCRGTNRKKQSSKIRPLIQQYNPKRQKFYEHSLYVITKTSTEKLKYWDVCKPPEHLIKPYEEAKTRFTDKLNRNIMQQLENDANKDKRKELTKIQHDVMFTLAKCNGNTKKSAELLGMNVDNIYFHQRYAKKKGYKWEEFT